MVADLLLATRRDPADEFEARLASVSDRCYGLVLGALTERLAQPDPDVGGSFRRLAVAAMDALDDSNRALAHRGLLPAFTLP